MNGLSFMQGWTVFVGSLAMITLILSAFGVLLGILKPDDALRRVGAIFGAIMLLTVLPGILINIWSAMSPWQQIALVAIGIGFWQLRRPRQRKRGNSRE